MKINAIGHLVKTNPKRTQLKPIKANKMPIQTQKYPKRTQNEPNPLARFGVLRAGSGALHLRGLAIQ